MGNKLLAIDNLGEIGVWDDNTGEALLRAKTGVSCYFPERFFSPCIRGGNLMGLLDKEGKYLLFRGVNGEIMTKIYCRGEVSAVACCPRGVIAATGHFNGGVQFWDIWQGSLLDFFEGDGEIVRLSFSPDCRYVAAVCSYCRKSGGDGIVIYDLGKKKIVKKCPVEGVPEIAWWGNDIIIMSSHIYMNLRGYDIKNRKEVLFKTTPDFKGGDKIAVSPGILFLARTMGVSVSIWDIWSGELLKEVSQDFGAVTSIAAADGEFAIGTEKGIIEIWERSGLDWKISKKIKSKMKECISFLRFF